MTQHRTIHSSIAHQPCTTGVINQYSALVKRIAFHLKKRMPAHIQADDLIQAGMIGLLEAHEQFDPQQGTHFESYAGTRIRGAMLDEIRRSDWAPRSVHRKTRMITEAMREIENHTGRDARSQEVASKLGLSLNDYHRILQDSSDTHLCSLEELSQDGNTGIELFADPQSMPIDRLTQSNFRAALTDAIASLPERERMIISFYYIDEMSLREIGQLLALSESRVCQIRGQAMLRLRARMSDWADASHSIH